MVKKEKAVWLILCVALIISIVIPVKGLFIDGIYAWHIRQVEFRKMLVEIGVLVLFLGIIWFGKEKSQKTLIKRVSLSGVICILFSWCHVIFLPMIVSGLYVGYVWLTGYSIRTKYLKYKISDLWFVDFLLGSTSVIIIFCLLSVLGIGNIQTLKIVVLVSGIVMLALNYKELQKDLCNVHQRMEKKTLTKCQSAMIIFMIIMVLVQIGRMNISIDFDSLWYGVRSEYMLNNGGGIYENPGTVGLVYTYSKGLEVLLLPLSDLASHSYLIFFNVWMAVLTLVAVYRIGRFYMPSTYALLAAACVSSIPAIMNMSITAKTDSMTLFVQVLMVLYLLYYLKEKQVLYILISASAFLLSWTLKPTAVVFSSAVFGMSILYLLGTRQLSLKAPWKHWVMPISSVVTLSFIWARTMKIVGIPVTSVFSSIFIKLGFHMKYPFADLPLYGGEGGGSLLAYAANTIYKMLLLPVGENMDHVVFAWGTSLIFFFIMLYLLRGVLNRVKMDTDRPLIYYAYTVMIPFVIVCFISLLMLGQIDGNYFMLLDVFIILFACHIISRIQTLKLRKSILIMLIPMLLLNATMVLVSNWAWSLGFTPIQIMNKGYFDHEAEQKKNMIERGNTQIWEILEADSQTRVIAAGNHPQVFAFPCNVQSYDDITSSWGNVVLVKTMDNFVQYLEYAKTDYIYMQAGEIEQDSRCHELMGYLIEAGLLKDVIYEQGNMLARVDLQGEYSEESSIAYEAYFENYETK